jgi:hypothetical protein
MLAWLVRGESNSGRFSPWRNFFLDEITHVEILEEISDAPREGYSRGNHAIDRVICEF